MTSTLHTDVHIDRRRYRDKMGKRKRDLKLDIFNDIDFVIMTFLCMWERSRPNCCRLIRKMHTVSLGCVRWGFDCVGTSRPHTHTFQFSFTTALIDCRLFYFRQCSVVSLLDRNHRLWRHGAIVSATPRRSARLTIRLHPEQGLSLSYKLLYSIPA